MRNFLLMIFLFACCILPVGVQSQSITINLNQSPANCQGDYKNGRIFAIVYGGTTPYTYLWNNGKNKAALDSLAPGNYSLTVTDAKGLTQTASGDVAQTKGVNVSPNIQGANCEGQPTGSIYLYPPNLYPPHSYLWSNGATTQSIGSLSIGNYSVTVSDKFGCTEKASIEIKKELSFTLENIGAPCSDILVLQVLNEKGTAPYTYLWNNGQTSSYSTFISSNFPFSVTVTDSKGCSGIKEYQGPIEIVSRLINPNVKSTDCDKANGSIAPIFDFEPISYKWSTGATTKSISNLKPGAYSLTITNATNCTTVFPFNVLGNMDIKITPEIKCNANIGKLTANVVKGGQAPFQFFWSTGEKLVNTITVPINTSYAVTIIDVKGCGVTKITEPLIKTDKLIADVWVDTINCPKIEIDIKNGVPPFSYKWSDGSNLPVIQIESIILPGVYTVTITDINGCSGDFSVSITQQHLEPKFLFDKKVCGNSASFSPKCNGAVFSYAWDNGTTSSSVTGLSLGKHYVTITNSQNNVKKVDSVLIITNLPCTILKGFVKHDVNLNCNVENNEVPFEDEIIEILPGPYYTKTNKNGAYSLALPTGNYTLYASGKNQLIKPCQSGFPVSIVNDTTMLNIPMQAANCPYLEVFIATVFLRRCFDNHYVVGYCNRGTSIAKNASIKITLDKDLVYKSASIPLTSQNANTLTFNIGDVAVGECKSFILTLNLNCNGTTLGQTHCVEAHIYPDSLCLPAPPTYSGAKVSTTATCNGNEVKLTIKNEGTAPMSSDKSYIIIEDQVIYKQGNFKLNPNEILEFKYPANGKTYRIEAEQENGYPLIPSMPSAWVEACGTNSQGGFSTGFVAQFGNNSAEPFLAIDCHQSIGSYDPNEKQAYPIGYDKQHYIAQNQSLEYILHFQNEGTDTAFTVVLLDTLSNLLEPRTLEMGASSHLYEWNLEGNGILKITFPKINLLTKKQDELASQGFVKFQIAQKKDLPLGSVIKNRAGIYFDFNDVILTNTVFHTLGKNFISITSLNDNEMPKFEVELYPNPTSDKATFVLPHLENQAIKFNVFDLTGRILYERQIIDNVFELDCTDIPNGIYLYQFSSKDAVLNKGRMSIVR